MVLEIQCPTFCMVTWLFKIKNNNVIFRPCFYCDSEGSWRELSNGIHHDPILKKNNNFNMTTFSASVFFIFPHHSYIFSHFLEKAVKSCVFNFLIFSQIYNLSLTWRYKSKPVWRYPIFVKSGHSFFSSFIVFEAFPLIFWQWNIWNT